MDNKQVNTCAIEGWKSDLRKIKEYLLRYYLENVHTPYLRQFLLDFIHKCRYTEDDVRPLLTKLGYEMSALKSDLQYILPAMASIHSLLLGFIPMDDILDGISKKDFENLEEFREKIALAYSLSTKLKEGGRNILRENYQNLPKFPKVEKLISECLEKLDGSHTLEINLHRKIPLSRYSLMNYTNLIDEATSVFIATAFVCGGLLGGASEEMEKIMWEIGIRLGRLCQIRDDFLDYANPQTTGKIPFADLLGKRRRFPLLMAYKFGTRTEKKQIDIILQKEVITTEDILVIIELITSSKVKDGTRKIVKGIQKEIQSKLESLPNVEPAKSMLFDLVELFSKL